MTGAIFTDKAFVVAAYLRNLREKNFKANNIAGGQIKLHFFKHFVQFYTLIVCQMIHKNMDYPSKLIKISTEAPGTKQIFT